MTVDDEGDKIAKPSEWPRFVFGYTRNERDAVTYVCLRRERERRPTMNVSDDEFLVGENRPVDQEGGQMSLEEASRQLELAIHDARVSFDCIELDDLDRAHTNAITARTALDAAETAVRAALEEQKERKKPSMASDD